MKGGQGLSQNSRRVWGRGQWMVEKSLVRRDPSVMCFSLCDLGWCPTDGTRGLGGVTGGRWQERKEACGDQFCRHELGTCHLLGTLLGARIRAAWVPAQGSLVTFWMHEEALAGLRGVLRPSAGEQPRKRRKMQSQCRKPQQVVCMVSREAKQRQERGEACVRELQAWGK